MRNLKIILPVLLASNSLILKTSASNLSSSNILNSNQLLRSTFFNLFQSSQSFCKMSVNLKEEVNNQKEFYDSMSLDDKRKIYKCGSNYITLNDMPSWKSTYSSNKNVDVQTVFKIDENLNDKVSIFVGDITTLEIDAIVNAANSRLAGGGGVDGAIHSAAGKQLLLNECSLKKDGLPTGNVLLTSGYKLPAKRIIHTVGPIGEKPDLLKSCYLNSLNLAKENNLRSLAFPCISTGVYGYPNSEAAKVALSTVREWLEQNSDSIDRIIFCLFLKIDVELYNQLLPYYFPK